MRCHSPDFGLIFPRKPDPANKYRGWRAVKWLLLIAMLFTIVLGTLLGLLVRGQTTSPSFRPLPTVASWATIGVAQTPTVQNPNAVIAQDVCPGYTLSNVQKTDRGLTGSLTLNGSVCNVYGRDYTNLTLTVYYDTETRLHVTIEDDEKRQYRIPDALVTIPAPASSIGNIQYTFNCNESPFEFWISRNDGDILFDTRGYKLIFETQYIELTTNMEQNYNVYGLGETIHSLKLGNNYTRTMWAKYTPERCPLTIVTKAIPSTQTSTVRIQSISSTSTPMAPVVVIIQLMLYIFEIPTGWIYC